MPRMFRNVKCYLGPWDFTGKSNKVSLDYSVEEKEQTVLDSNSFIYFPGLMKVAVDMGGFADVGDHSTGTLFTDPVLQAAVGETVSVPFSFSTGGADGDMACMFQGLRSKYDPIAGSVGDLQEFNLKVMAGAARLVRAKVGLPKASYASASGNGTAYQLGALSATQKLYAAVHFFAVASPGSVVIKVQSDTVGFPSPVDQITFTAATGQTSEWREVSGAITDDYWRVTYARTGGTTFQAAVLFGIGPA